MSKKLISLLFPVVFLAACQSQPVSQDDAAPALALDTSTAEDTSESAAARSENASPVAEEAPTPAPLTPAQQLTQSLIENGRLALLADRLLTPEEDNANLYFQAALGRDPGNFDAIQGIAQIVEIYTDWAWQKAQNRQYRQAGKYLDRARSVNAQDPLIVEMNSRIEDLKLKRQQQAAQAKQRQAKVQKNTVSSSSAASQTEPSVAEQEGVFRLPKDLFTLSEKEIVVKIQPIINAVAATQSRLEINWPNDKQARLIYQIINSRVTDFRVRAMIFHRARYTVALQQD
ncbi:hypothetical protein [Marinomonas posidonica]|uniref:Lipoprotein n=1 Tax=Marinomonas posidonica (strain CECT 7376 / NCIMB 14433 / IVIA-Po-181) TaxID=491952 RepID=F6CUM1_MARPP|nr:hypothetical protein [Marinomonas posidonica]AEF54131.1 hypothetical protein Mar181_1082 [Marinomonas posidonica IVIA-Po-181]